MQKEKIPFLDLKEQYQQVKEEIFPMIEKVFESNAFTNGFTVKSFEDNFAEYCESSYSIAVNNGTSALHLAVEALGIGQGDEIIIPANTFIATAWAAAYVKATPVFVDCDPDTWQIDPSKIEEKITDKTKAIIAVHLYGQPFDIDAVKAIADKHNVFLIEDAAQAHGAKYKGKRVGQFGEMGCFSFYPGKNLGTYGEGGGITTNNEKYKDHLHKLRNHGCAERYYHDIVGYNMRMGGVEGAVLDVKLKYLDGWNARRQEIAKRYKTEVKNPKIMMQKCPEGYESVFHLFVITTKDRAALEKHLNDLNIWPGKHYPVPCHLQKAFSELNYKKGDFPHSEYLAAHCLTMPMFAELKDEAVQRVIDALNSY
jgi:dTDP-4-amino-4,6-dideoxygalactose transaminase